jgi:hypothetical protein
LDTKVITKHHRTKEKKTHTKPHLCCLLAFFLFFFFFCCIFFQGISKLNSKTKMLLRRNLPHTLFLYWSHHSLSLSQKYDLLEHKQKVYSANKVYITTSIVCQAQTWIQDQFVLRSNQKCGVLEFKHNVYLDWSSRV